MIRLEVKIIIPDHQNKREFLQNLLDRIAADDSFFWQTHFDIMEGQRASLEAVLGQDGFPFLDGNQMLIFSFDFVSKNQAERICSFFRELSVTNDIEINEFAGKRRYGEFLDIGDPEQATLE